MPESPYTAEDPEPWPTTYPPQGVDTILPWLPADPMPNPEPEAQGLTMPDPGVKPA